MTDTMDRREIIIMVLEADIKRADELINSFDAKFLKDPFENLSWSLKVFDAAAHVHVIKPVVKALKAGQTLEAVQAYAVREVLAKGEFGSRSTSVTQNLCTDMELAAWVHVMKVTQ